MVIYLALGVIFLGIMADEAVASWKDLTPLQFFAAACILILFWAPLLLIELVKNVLSR